MSGGVDSSVAAHLLVEQGYDVIGLFMRTGAHESTNQDELPLLSSSRGCCGARDAADARRVSDRLNIPFYSLDFEDDFNRIKDYFADEYLRGRTPNPCVVCNTWLKFGKLWRYAQTLGADLIATGHYARVIQGDRGVELWRARDEQKDQSYFLFGIDRGILHRVLFPVGNMVKSDVRRIAAEAGLGLADKPESQEICFVPSGRYDDFLKEHRPETHQQPGEIVDLAGRALGSHEGIGRFTIGQRKGLGVAVGEPRYVVRIEPDTKKVVIGPREELLRSEAFVDRVRWLVPMVSDAKVACQIKIRHLHQPTPGVVEQVGVGEVRVLFDAPQSAVTPGQAAVFYDGPRVLGGGWIR